MQRCKKHNLYLVWIGLAAIACFRSLPLWGQVISPAIQPVPPSEFPVRVAVKLVDISTQKPIPYASVRFMGTKRGLRADSNGFFSVVMTQNDTLKISSLGFHDLIFTKDPARQTSYYITLSMVSKIYELSAVQIMAQRKKDMNNPFLRWEYKAKFMPKYWLFYEPTGEPPAPATMMSPVTYLYDRFSRRGKAARKLQDMVAAKAKRKWVAQRYNPEKVSQWTGLQSPELEEFMKFCSMPDYFVEASSEAQIIDRTFHCLQDFDNREEE